MSQPLISVVVPSLNQGQFIEQTITSILGQNYAPVELIVIDGGSTDNTAEIIKKYASSISHYVSEPDHGQAEAINKGFRLAQGAILGWLNSDDMYLPCTLAKVVELFKSTQQASVLVYGGCLRFIEGTPYTHGILPAPFDPERLTWWDYIEQPSTFWSRHLWETVGELNESLTYSMDWEWFIRASKVCRFTPLNDFLSIFRFHEHHKTGVGGLKRMGEIVRIVEKYAPPDWIVAYRDVYQHYLPLKTWLHRLLRFKLHRLRYVLYPQLYFKHGRHRIDTIMSWQ